MFKLKLSKERPAISKRHLHFLIFILILSLLTLDLTIYKNYRSLIYPQLHINQPSPEEFVKKEAKKLSLGQAVPEVIEHGPRSKKQIALTFDADMTYAMDRLLKKHLVKSWYNAAIKDTLDKEQVKATVFLTGLWVLNYQKQAKALADDPLIEIGNHSYSHPAFAPNCYSLAFLDNSKNNYEITSSQAIIKLVTGITPKYFRFPGGCFEKIDLEDIARNGLKIVHWDVAATDGFNPNADAIVRYVEFHVQNGSIVVFHIHDGQYAPKTNDALIRIIPDLRKRGFEFVKISELLGDN